MKETSFLSGPSPGCVCVQRGLEGGAGAELQPGWAPSVLLSSSWRAWGSLASCRRPHPCHGLQPVGSWGTR